MAAFLCTTLMMFLAAMGIANAQAAAVGASPSLSITLSTNQKNVKIGSEIWVDAVTTNVSDKTVGIGFLPGPYESLAFSVTVQVRDSQDRPVGPEYLDQPGCKGNPKCSQLNDESRYLSPGESAKDHFLIDKKYDLTQPGLYTIQVVRRDKRTLEIVRSNILSLTVRR